MEKLKTFVSKKLFITVATMVFLLVNKQAGSPFDEATVKEIVMVVAAYLFGQSVVDTATALKK